MQGYATVVDGRTALRHEDRGRGSTSAMLAPPRITSSETETATDPHASESIPAWVHLNENNEKDPFLPDPTVPNTRHYKPPTKYETGRKWDKYRTEEPGLLSEPIADHQIRWIPFMQAGPNIVETNDVGLIRSRQWMEENMPIFARAWQEEDIQDPEASARSPRGFRGLMYRGKWLISPERQERTVQNIWRLLLKNAFVPLTFRLTILAFAAAALGVGVDIFRSVNAANNDSDPYNQCIPQPSTYMAIIVSSVAIPYLCYITWDEYTSKPLGLRSVATKVLLLLCDLYFIVFSASNVSLAFSALFDKSWACYDSASELVGDVNITVSRTCPNNPGICYHHQALCGVLVVSLSTWLLCFSVSVLRVVEKLRLDLV